MSSRRKSSSGATDAQKRAAALTALSEAKKSGKRRLDGIKLDEELVYESVSEDEYDRIVSSRRRNKNGSFIVDDGFGYVDNGEEDWENEELNEPDSGHAQNPQKKSNKRKASAGSAPLPAAFIKRSQPERTKMSAVQRDSYAQELIDGLRNSEIPVELVDEIDELDHRDIALFGQHKDLLEIKRGAIADDTYQAPMIQNIAPKCFAQPDEIAAIPCVDEKPCSDSLIVIKSEQPVDDTNDPGLPSNPAEILDEKSWFTETSRGPEQIKPFQASDLIGEGGMLNLFWLDAYEDPYNAPGKIFLFGKAKHEHNEDVSCCVVVNKVDRNLFVMPRTHELHDVPSRDGSLLPEVDMNAVYEEFTEFASKHGITEFLSKPVMRKYAFDNPECDIPAEAEVLKVVYSATAPTLPRNSHGRTFSHIFGTQTSALENFLLKRRLMGPQWLSIAGAKPSNSGSWCKAEFAVESPKQITKSDGGASPTIRVLSLSIVCSFNSDSNMNEIAGVSGLLHSNVSIEGTTSDQTNLTHFSAIRPLGKSPWPHDFASNMERSKLGIDVFSNERALLSFLAAQVHQIDPDLIVGHDLFGITLDLLMSRMLAWKITHWSKLGRLRNNRPPRVPRTGQMSGWALRSLGGRLFCDTSASAKEVIRETSYDLSSLSKSLLNVTRDEIIPEKMLSHFGGIVDVMRHCTNDAFLSIRLMFHLQVLPLTKQLASLGGHTWSRSLQSARAERIEYLLLHELHHLKYIKPEKYTLKERQATSISDQNGQGHPQKKRKAAYAGGLVLEPIKGFYDKFVLLLDFNSLYPSIIQEYNLCFTTVDHWKNLDADTGLPELPKDGSTPGILPRVIKTLVERRRSVKSLLKNEKSLVIRQELDIRQQALKLVANSMYGCLGYVGSRFYCKPLAALITSQGRTILTDTVHLIESLDFKVIYGDTDSVCIATNCTDIQRVNAIGHQIKREVNKLYKTLEIEVDGIFKSLLLLQKKKYAALTVTEKDGKFIEKREIKGLEMVRRDWCPLSKRIGECIIDIILNGSLSRDDVVDAIHEHLSGIAQQLQANQISIGEFIITKGLSKDPSEYPDASSLPHVAVATQMVKQGTMVRVGDYIPYVICESGEKTLASRAFHPSALLDQSRGLRLDIKWYLTQQIVPPVLRLCAHIEGTDASRLADCLGLDGSKFHNSDDSGQPGQSELFQSSLSIRHLDDDEAFKSVERMVVCCPECAARFEFKGIFDMQSLQSGLQCATQGCPFIFAGAVGLNSVKRQVWQFVWRRVTAYNEIWKTCEDKSCGYRTRFHSTCPICNSQLNEEIKASDIYLLLRYLCSLFDAARINVRIAQENATRTQKSLPLIDFQISTLQKSYMDAMKLFIEQNLLNMSSYFKLDTAEVFNMFQNLSLSISI
uniref:DNA polymerase n=1 Tax=Spongospora subterranea TaxID=70186 RepID=A0A0H5QMZ5_9EUKA|eukprot:CRZ02927.1 hypothetical protein [Spongospora subterranea]